MAGRTERKAALEEVLERLTPEGRGRRPAGRKPGPEALRAAVRRMEAAEGPDWAAEVYENGYAVYIRDGRRTVIWLPDCARHVWYFLPPPGAQEERKDFLPTRAEASLLDQPWPMAVMLAGEKRMEANEIRSGSRESGLESTEERTELRWISGARFEDPLETVLREEERTELREAVRTAVAGLRAGPRAAFHALYERGETLREAAEREGIRLQTVWIREANLKKGIRERLTGILSGRGSAGRTEGPETGADEKNASGREPNPGRRRLTG